MKKEVKKRKIKLRKFNQTDWDTYAGCTRHLGSEPLIGEMEVEYRGSLFIGDIVIDRHGIEIYAIDNESEETIEYYLKAHFFLAQKIVTKFLHYRMHHDDLTKEYGFKTYY